MGQYTKYPNQIDTSTELPKATDLVTPVNGEAVNRLREAILAIENELGIDPSGTFSTIRARLDAISGEASDSYIPIYQNDSIINQFARSINFTGNVEVSASLTGVNVNVTGGEGGGADTAVDSLAALSALDDSALDNGQTVSVATIKDTYLLDKTSTVPSDGITVLNTSSGTGRWARQNNTSSQWRNQVNWYVDYVGGSDENSGSSDSEPIKTQAEWVRRVGTYPAVEMNMYFLSDSPENMIWDLDVDFDKKVNIYGMNEVEIFSGITDNVQNWSPADNLDGRFTCNELPVSWTASNLVGKLCRLDTGVIEGYTFWIVRDLGTKTCRMSYPFDIDLWDTGDMSDETAFTIIENVKLTGQHIFQPRGHGGQLFFYDLEFGNPSYGSHMHRVTSGYPFFMRCKIHGLDIQGIGGIVTLCSYLTNSSAVRVYDNGELDSSGSVYPYGVTVHSGKFLSWRDVSQGQIVLESPTSQLDATSLGIFDTSYGLVMNPLSKAFARGYLWGSNIATVGLWIRAGAILQFDFDFPLNIQTFGTEVIVGGENKLYSDLPYINYANQAAAIEINTTDPSTFSGNSVEVYGLGYTTLGTEVSNTSISGNYISAYTTDVFDLIAENSFEIGTPIIRFDGDNFEFDAITTPIIYQAQVAEEADTAPSDFTIMSQQPANDASGDNTKPGNIVLDLGNPNNDGSTYGKVSIENGTGGEKFSIGWNGTNSNLNSARHLSITNSQISFDSAPYSMLIKSGDAYGSAATNRTGANMIWQTGLGRLAGTDRSGNYLIGLGTEVSSESASMIFGIGTASGTPGSPTYVPYGTEVGRIVSLASQLRIRGPVVNMHSTTGNANYVANGGTAQIIGQPLTLITYNNLLQCLNVSSVTRFQPTYPSDVALSSDAATTIATIAVATSRPVFVSGSIRIWDASMNVYVSNFSFTAKNIAGTVTVFNYLEDTSTSGLGACVTSATNSGANVIIQATRPAGVSCTASATYTVEA